MKPTMELPSRKKTRQLGTVTANVKGLDSQYDAEKEKLIVEAGKLRDTLEASGEVDRFEKMHPKKRPEVNASFEGSKIEQLWEFTEENGTKVLQWCQGEVVAVLSNSRVQIEWEERCLREGDPKVTQEKMMISKWNKHVEEAWMMNLA